MCSPHSYMVLSSGNAGWPQTRDVIFVNATAVRERTQAWLAPLPQLVPGQPRATPSPEPHCTSAGPGQGCRLLSQPSITRCFTTSWRVTSKCLAPRRATVFCGGGGCPRPPQALPGSIWAAATARMAAVILGKLAPAPAAGIRVQGGADVGTEFIRSAQVLEEVMSKCHAPCVATGGGGNQLPLNISRSQPAGLPAPTSLQPARAQPGLSPPCAPAASLAVQKVAQHPPAASVRVFALSCRQWDELGNGNGRACTKK